MKFGSTNGREDLSFEKSVTQQVNTSHERNEHRRPCLLGYIFQI